MQKPEESKAKPRFGTHRDEALREKHLEAAKATPLPEDAETLKDKLIDEQRILMEEYASKGEVPPKEIKTLIDTLKGMIREMSESEEVDLEKFQKMQKLFVNLLNFIKIILLNKVFSWTGNPPSFLNYHFYAHFAISDLKV
ncbi:MAG: hypothetical protein HWD61_13070 [Parachlamydiaceae bacterium]|nr:MAG: hypothetical protein HWD61_13070 [Parachlamydiaceae bacterium]